MEIYFWVGLELKEGFQSAKSGGGAGGCGFIIKSCEVFCVDYSSRLLAGAFINIEGVGNMMKELTIYIHWKAFVNQPRKLYNTVW